MLLVFLIKFFLLLLPTSNTTLSLTASAAYSIILNTGGNKIITVLQDLKAAEIIFVVAGGYITFSGSFQIIEY